MIGEIARTKGETKKHIYCRPYGYPIRLCNWTIPENEFIEIGDVPLCKNCQLALDGKGEIAFAPREIEVSK